MRISIIPINYIFIHVYYIILMCKLYQITFTSFGIFLSVCHRDEVSIGAVFPWENGEEYTGASGTQMCGSALNVVQLQSKEEGNIFCN